MGIDRVAQTSLFLWALALGVFLGAVYDILRVFGLERKEKAFVVFIRDFIFCMFSTLCMLILFFNLSYGKARVYAFVALILGFLLWRFTAGRLFIFLLLKLIGFVEKLLNLLKMRISAVIKGGARRIYTKNYCRRTVKNLKSGRGFKKERNLSDAK